MSWRNCQLIESTTCSSTHGFMLTDITFVHVISCIKQCEEICRRVYKLAWSSYANTGTKVVVRDSSHTLSLGQKSESINRLLNSSKQAIRIRSGVAGLLRGNHSWCPTSALAAIIASLMAKKTAEARKNGGSPTALDEWIAFTFGWPWNQNGEISWKSFSNSIFNSSFSVTRNLAYQVKEKTNRSGMYIGWI